MTPKTVALFAFVSTCLLASAARAYYPLPNEIVSHLKISCPKPIWDGQGCTLCHASNAGGCGSAVRPFGKWLVENGLSCANGNVVDPSKLDPLLDEAAATGVDSNCDGVPDVEQLSTCNWQVLSEDACGADGGATPEVSPESVSYGCAASSEPVAPGIAALALGGALASVVARRRRRMCEDGPRACGSSRTAR